METLPTAVSDTMAIVGACTREKSGDVEVVEKVKIVEVSLPSHPSWPGPNDHLYGKWYTNKGMPKATQYRVCMHPDCTHVEYRDAPNA